MALCIGLAHVHGTTISTSHAPVGHTHAPDGFDDSSSRSGRTADTNTPTQPRGTTWHVPNPEAEAPHASDALPRTNGTGSHTGARHRQSVAMRRLQGESCRNNCNLPHGEASTHLRTQLRPRASSQARVSRCWCVPSEYRMSTLSDNPLTTLRVPSWHSRAA